MEFVFIRPGPWPGCPGLAQKILLNLVALLDLLDLFAQAWPRPQNIGLIDFIEPQNVGFIKFIESIPNLF